MGFSSGGGGGGGGRVSSRILATWKMAANARTLDPFDNPSFP